MASCSFRTWDENKHRSEKTEFMSIGRSTEGYDVYIGEERIHQTENYTYLCVNIESKNRQEIEINKRITKYNNTVEMLYPLLKDKFVPRECKVTIYNTILKPILL